MIWNWNTSWVFTNLHIILLASILHASIGQTNEIDDVVEPTSKLENTVVSDMLRIVDHKFDTLTTRISALERAVSGLQYFSIGQFRHLSKHIQGTQRDLKNVNGKVCKCPLAFVK